MISKPVTVSMYDFFYEELKSLKKRTGFNQWEKLNELPDAATAIHELIQSMVVETNKHPYDLVKLEVKQRVISRAVVEDPEFIGMNERFIVRALGSWWRVNGNKIVEAFHRTEEKTEPQSEPVTGEAREEWFRKWSQSLQGFDDKIVGKDEKQKRIAPLITDHQKAISKDYVPPPPEYEFTQDIHRQWIKANFDLLTGKRLPTWISEEEWIKKQQLP